MNLQTISNLNVEGCFGSSGCLITLLLARGIVPVGRLSCVCVCVCVCVCGDKRENEHTTVYCRSEERCMLSPFIHIASNMTLVEAWLGVNGRCIVTIISQYPSQQTHCQPSNNLLIC